ncbi:MAG: HD domain-containing phosphohydrolase, partial [Mobilitalea sp.]
HVLVEEFNDMALGNYDNEIPDHLKQRTDEFAILGKSLAVMKNETSQLITNLNLANEETEASLEEVIATEDELKQQNERLSISENMLKNSNEYNKAIISVIPDVIFILNQTGTFTDCQAREENMLYMPKEEFIGKNLKDIMPDDIASIGYQKIQIAIETGNLQSFEYELEFADEKKTFELRIIKCFTDRVMAIARDVTDQRLYQKQIEYLSYHDQMTGLHNRRFFEDELKRLDNEENLPLCIIMADVNGLKLVNDSFGHKAGDMLLRKFANVLIEVYPSEDGIFRVGGDEFVILIPNMNRELADELVGKIKNKCDQEIVNAISLSVSFGWEIKSQLNEDINTVLKSAEDYMYKKKLFEGPSMRGKTIGLIINTLHEKNKREEQHSHRVSEICEKLANTLKMPDHEMKVIRNAGLLHDIGKIAISENLLNKPGKLTPEEFEEITRHPEIGYRILCSANEMTDMAEYVLSHHERWDGKGYPRGLAGEEIPLQSRMIAIADAFDAMTSVRSYRLPVSEEEAAKEILKNAGTQFDPELAHRFVHETLGYQF